jgi:hypothetical protein
MKLAVYTALGFLLVLPISGCSRDDKIASIDSQFSDFKTALSRQEVELRASLSEARVQIARQETEISELKIKLADSRHQRFVVVAGNVPGVEGTSWPGLIKLDTETGDTWHLEFSTVFPWPDGSKRAVWDWEGIASEWGNSKSIPR